MTNLFVIALLAVVLTGCAVAERERATFYTRAEIDAILAESACRNMARTVLQLERCLVLRR